MNYEDLTKEALIEVLKRRDAAARYGLRWERERIEQDLALNRDFVALDLKPDLCVGPSPWHNLLIEGDNFDALRHLATTHAGAFHLIYIDPPYNTGRKDFVYNDHFVDASNRYRHSTWLEFMHARLALARSLLRDDGAIFVSIDDNELPNLWLLMNQVFGERCFVANIVWQKRYSRENRGAIGDAHEYLLVFSPNPDGFKARRGRIPLSAEQAKVYRNPENPKETDPAKRWRGIPMTAQGFRPNQMYEIVAPNGTVHRPPEGRCWSMVESEFLRLKTLDRIYWGKEGDASPSVIRYLSEVEGLVPWTWWTHEEVGHTDEARKEVQQIFGTQTAFDTPKPTRLLDRVVQIGAPEKDALVLDFFAGSGTTGQAVMRKNTEDGGHRRFVLVSNREATDENPRRNLCRDVTQKRLEFAAAAASTALLQAAASPIDSNLPKPQLHLTSVAYLVAKRVLMHRFEEDLSDSMLWAFALEACGHPMTPAEPGVSVSVHREHLLVYCADVRSASLESMRSVVRGHNGPAAVVSWSPDVAAAALGNLAARVSIVAVPDDLKRAFKQGNARIASGHELAAAVDNDDGRSRAGNPEPLQELVAVAEVHGGEDL